MGPIKPAMFAILLYDSLGLPLNNKIIYCSLRDFVSRSQLVALHVCFGDVHFQNSLTRLSRKHASAEMCMFIGDVLFRLRVNLRRNGYQRCAVHLTRVNSDQLLRL